MSMQEVPQSISFPKEEEAIVGLWERLDAFQTSLKRSEGKPEYSFYDGPPFATGLPHYGHILAGTIKDIVTRYAHQTGHHVTRRFGWDCHGLPIEFEIDKELGVKTRDDVLAMGIDKYNEACRSIVMRYSTEWERIVKRLGRWIDFKNDYKTMDRSFMESVWWVFRQLHEKNLVYRGFKVMPYSVACNTPLSNFEANMLYKEVSDPSVVVSFPLEDEPATSLIAWTTTPWTLPSNLALCVNPELDYVKIKDKATGNVYVLLEKRLVQLYKDPSKGAEFTVLERLKGASLKGRRYVPLFNYFVGERARGAFTVLADGFVTDDSGTGVVHCAPAFGEDDYRVCTEAGIVVKGRPIICPVDANGKFTAEVPDYAGVYIKDADKAIARRLKDDKRLVHQGTIVHSYPFCWRSETPLIYRAVPSWFVGVEKLRDRLLENNRKSHWVPDFVQEKRFANWLAEARDWCVSRNRYWGTPLPIWMSEDEQEMVVIGSVEELEALSGVKVGDLHRHNIDHIKIPSRRGPKFGVLSRVDEVFDCIAAGSSVSLSNGLSVPIETLSASDQTVLSFDSGADQPGLKYSPQSAWRRVGTRACIELTFADGRKLVCTPEHRLRAPEGDVTASDAAAGRVQVLCGGEQPVFAPSVAELMTEATWSLSCGGLQLSTATAADRVRAMVFCRLLGFMLTDGSFQYHSTSGQVQACAFLGHELDVQSFCADVVAVVGESPTTRKEANTWRVTMPSALTKAFTALPGVSVGRRTNQPYSLPSFVATAPLSLVREFLGGLFGGDGRAPSLTYQVEGATKVAKLSSVGLSASTTVMHETSTRQMLQEVVVLLGKLGVTASMSVASEKKLTGGDRRVQLLVLVGSEGLLPFVQNVGFRYCTHKAARLSAAASWCRLQATVKRQNDFLLKVVGELTDYAKVMQDVEAKQLSGAAKAQYVQKNLGMTVAAALAEAQKRLAAEEVPIDGGVAMSAERARHFLRQGGEERAYEVTPPDAWFAKIGALDLFKDDLAEEKADDESPTKKSRKVTDAVKQGRDTLPVFRLQVVGARDVGAKEVFDITVPEFQYFVANGVVVHNCWFESGSMPYAQSHYPFENKELFSNSFPADFIAEGLDQTRGWFYTLLVLSTALFDKPAFKNLIVNGLVLAADGKKMSKRLKNYPDPQLVVDRYGADALRLYLINSPVVRAEPLKFKEEGVNDVIKEVFLPWFNAYRFLVENARAWEKRRGAAFVPDVQAAVRSTNVMDQWILAATSSLIGFVRGEMKAYRLYTVVPRLVSFINQLTNWYVRFNRKRLKGDDADSLTALRTLYEVLLTMSRAMAPFTPFFTEYMYQNLRAALPANLREDSLHYLSFPEPVAEAANADIERAVGYMQTVIELGRMARERRTRPIKHPLRELTVVITPKVGDVATAIADIRRLENYIVQELNIKQLTLTTNESAFVRTVIKPDESRLGKRLRNAKTAVISALLKLPEAQLEILRTSGQLNVEGQVITGEDVQITREFSGDTAKFEAVLSSDGAFVGVLDLTVDAELAAQGLAREVTNRVQKLRKKAGLVPSDPIELFYRVDANADRNGMQKVFVDQAATIHAVTGVTPVNVEARPRTAVTIIREAAEIGETMVELSITRLGLAFASEALEKKFPNAGADVEVLLASRDYPKLRDILTRPNSGSLDVTLNGVTAKVVLGHDVFLSAADRVNARK